MQQLYGDSIDKEGIAFCFQGGQDDFLFKVRNMWTVMGDYLSRQYAGTDSTISRVSRDGKEGFIGKIDHQAKVAQRFLINVLNDNPMQTTIDLLLGKHLLTGAGSELNQYLQLWLMDLQDSYSLISTVKVVTFS